MTTDLLTHEDYWRVIVLYAANTATNKVAGAGVTGPTIATSSTRAGARLRSRQLVAPPRARPSGSQAG